MSDTVIKVENLSKQYRLGNIGTGTLRHDLQRWWCNVTGKEDPTLKIGQENNLITSNSKEIDDYVWALKNINFEVKQGEILGIIGKNGAGKSTLLKILSQVTNPTTGNIKVKGRIASLLEVGTGFHPELTGRENIFLNGAILGMTKIEIRSKFDEIVDFAGVEKYIDTPVKRYSSGMYVRLAFGVAAHLEPEILIVDEVLAVGDAEFQKKAIGKMKDVSQNSGRTVLFVSHNLTAIKSLCTKAILLKNGSVFFEGTSHETINKYQNDNIGSTKTHIKFPNTFEFNNEYIELLEIILKPTNGLIIDVESGISIKLKFFNKRPNTNIGVSFNIFTLDDIHLFEAPCFLSTNNNSETCIYEIEENIPPLLLNNSTYKLGLLIGENQQYVLLNLPALLSFSVEDSSFNRGSYYNKYPGLIRPNVLSNVHKIYSK